MKLSEQPTIQQNDWAFLPRGGEMTALIRAKDWSATPVGEPGTWPQSLRTALSILLGSKFPMFLWWGPDLVCFYNDAYRPSLGKEGKHPAILGQRAEEGWAEIWHIIKPLIDQVLAGGESTWSEDQLIPIYRNGCMENVWWTFSYSPVNDESGRVAGVFVTCFETTEKVENMRSLQASDQRFQNLVREASIGIIVLSGEEYIVNVVNDAYGKLIERTAAELLGKRLFDIVPDAEDPFRKLLDRVRLTGESVYLYAHPYLVYTNGKKIEGFIDFIYQPYKEADGSITGVMALVHDVTERTMTRKRIEEAEAKARLAIESGDLGTYEIDLQTDDMITSDRFNAIWGIPHSTHRSKIVDRIHPDDRETRIKAHRDSIKNGFIDYEARVIWEDQSEHWVRVKGKLLYDDQHRPITLIGVIQDISEQKQSAELLTRQVKERTLELQRSNDDLMQFAHVISHDLKEPVRKVKVFSNRIREELEPLMPEKAISYLTRIQSASDRMYAMIEGVLNYATVSSADEAVEDVDLNETIKTIQGDLEMPIQQKNARIVYGELPVVRGAAILIYQLFYNLINNSLKFSRKEIAPVIRVSSAIVREGDGMSREGGKDFVIIQVEDNGIGFEQEQASNIFNSFSRLNSKDKFEGTGLGLSLSKKIVERHGGSISASGVPGKGTIITIKIPYHKNVT
jgi:PAS domain S-box-containing protein